MTNFNKPASRKRKHIQTQNKKHCIGLKFVPDRHLEAIGKKKKETRMKFHIPESDSDEKKGMVFWSGLIIILL